MIQPQIPIFISPMTCFSYETRDCTICGLLPLLTHESSLCDKSYEYREDTNLITRLTERRGLFFSMKALNAAF